MIESSGKKIINQDHIEYMSFSSADSLKSEIRKRIICHDECGQHLVNISIDHEILRLIFSQTEEE
jgi:hypothetical protein